ncbi:MAG: PEP-CTERM sorting domain-containing protein, partial [Verrucomicrobia bacterium]|nr:PEP-CTERM sorting domain-containing protein [Verrucomicrobiota bacterium]
GSNFESDNWTLRDPAYGTVAGDGATLPGTAVAQYNVNDAGTQTTVTDVSQINTSSVPEPSSGAMLLLGMVALLKRRKRN